MSDKPPINNQLNHQPTTTGKTGGGGGGGGVSANQTREPEPEPEPSGADLLRAFGATSDALIREAAAAHPSDLIEALILHVKGEDGRAGLVLHMLTGKTPIPPAVTAAVKRARERRVEEAAELNRLRQRRAALTPETRRAAAERAGVDPDADDPAALRAMGDALAALEREAAEAADRQHLIHLWDTLTPEGRDTVRRRLQLWTAAEVLEYAEKSPRKRAAVLAAIERLRRAARVNSDTPASGRGGPCNSV